MMQLLYMISFSTSLIFTKMYHPLAMGLMLLIQTTLIAMLTCLINKTFWFSYILFLIFMGGMLVLFIYVTLITLIVNSNNFNRNINLSNRLINKTFWFSYILFLIFMGGMLVLFIYVTSLTSNEMFYFLTKQMLLLFLMIGVMMMMITFFKDYLFTNMNMNNFEMI